MITRSGEVSQPVDKQMEGELKVVSLSEREHNDRYSCYSRRVGANGTDKFEKIVMDEISTDACCLTNRFLHKINN
ncbi:MAG: hypothetical protein M3261_02215 [Thermoproteota archaeon]|nr:hypothetical protein [Thermoproteota archaeon]